MFLKQLNLVNFRNYESLKLDFKKNVTILVGKNAQGKTNLIESIYFLATLDSFRASQDSEYVLWDKESSAIKAIIEKDSGSEIELDVVITPGRSKILKVNSLKKNLHEEFLGNLIVVSFSVEDLLLLRGGPKERRKWLDLAICQFYPAYYSRLNVFNKIKQQKQALLKSFNGYFNNISTIQKDMLESWNEQIAVAGSNIIYLRQKFLKEIYPLAKEKTFKVSDSSDCLEINYDSSIGIRFSTRYDIIPSVEEIKNNYKNKLKEEMNNEIARNKVLIGPHRDDIKFYVNDKQADTFASQGQQRTVVLALKLSEVDLVKQVLNEDPVLILDDVLAELDLSRQKILFGSIVNVNQTVITTTDMSLFKDKNLENSEIFTVEKGVIANGKTS